MLKKSDPDFRGARGSNTGDDYHELWAVRQALRLLERDGELTAMKLEGMTADLPDSTDWDGVDCMLMFGDVQASTARRVEIQQLKYSAAHPGTAWTVARVCTAPKGKRGASVIGRLASAFRKLKAERQSMDASSITVRLVSNQPIGADLLQALADAKQLFLDRKSVIAADKAHLSTLRDASGLKADEFIEFADRLDLSTATGSRFSIEAEVLKTLAKWDDVEFVAIADSLRRYLHDLMLPERASEVVTYDDVLLKIGAGDRQNLFPAPTGIHPIADIVHRQEISALASEMLSGRQYICLHGAGGLGKTTSLQQIEANLPSGSLFVTFDCYGGGSYLNAAHFRHRPQDAFVQLSNELSEKLLLPNYLVPGPHLDYPRQFMKRLVSAASLLAASEPNALLVIALDAVDNAITAASARQPAEPPFLRDFFTFDNLPANVRFIVSCRTSRLDGVAPPSRYQKFELKPFHLAETTTFVRRFWQAPAAWLGEFQALSHGVPRVQTYALRAVNPDYEKAIDALLPHGKALHQVFADQLQTAVCKHGGEELVSMFCAAVTDMPRPVPIDDLAGVLAVQPTAVIDILTDLAPGFLVSNGSVNFADEDFEAYTREQGAGQLSAVRTQAADHFLSGASNSAYGALSVAPALYAAGRHSELLDFVEKEPEPPAGLMADAAMRREIGITRLRLAIQVARQAGDVSRALRFVLMGAEAIRSEHNLREFLFGQRRLSVRFAEDVTNRLILRDPDRIEKHGSIIAHMIGHFAATKHVSAVSQVQRRLQSWFKARWSDYQGRKGGKPHERPWEFDAQDFSELLYTTAIIRGAQSSVDHFLSQNWQFAIPAGLGTLDRLLAEGRTKLVSEIGNALPPARAAFVWVALASSGTAVDLGKMESSLRALRAIIKPTAELAKQYGRHEKFGPITIDVLLAGLEILVLNGRKPHDFDDWLAPFLDQTIRRIDNRFASESHLLDAIMRSFFLKEALAGRDGDPKQLLCPRPKVEGKDNRRGERNTSEHDREINDVIASVAKFYMWRARFIALGTNGDSSSELIKDALKHLAENAWSIRRQWETGGMRAKAAESLALLAGDKRVSELILETVVRVREGWSPYSSHSADKLFYRLRNVQSLHARLLEMVSREADERRRDRIGAGDKSTTIATLADWIVAISPDDARALFQTAIGVAQELDDEIVDQVALVNSLVTSWRQHQHDPQIDLACQLADVIEDAGVRLSNLERFPWVEGVQAMTLLHFGTALGCVARWHDTDTANLDQTLGAVVDVGLRQVTLGTGQAAALTQLLHVAPADVVAGLTAAAQSRSSDSAKLAEFFARNDLLQRTGMTTHACEFARQVGTGPWAEALRQSSNFEMRLADEISSDGVPGRTDRARTSIEVDWTPTELVDADVLKARVAKIIEASREQKTYLSASEVFHHARKSVRASDRSRHLDALLAIQQSSDDWDALPALMSAIGEWSAQPAIPAWARSKLPAAIATYLPYFSRYFPRDDGMLDSAVKHAGLSSERTLQVLLDGIERNVGQLSGGAILGLVGRLAGSLSPTEAAELAKWYIARLAMRLDDEHRVADTRDVAHSRDEALGRFFFAMLGDVDVYLRWRCGHAVRLLGEFNDIETIRAIWQQYDRKSDKSYRQPDAPYYWLASRLWLLIAMDRVSAERPDLIASFAESLFGIATDENLPHLLLRAYASDTLSNMNKSGAINLDSGQLIKLAEVNKSLLAYDNEKKRKYGGYDFFDPKAKGNVRFHFNGTDTLRKWYSSWLSIFADVSPAEFVQAADRFISAEWGVIDEGPYGSKEIRASRFTERNWQRSSNSQGSLPTLERYQTHLEWHAMWCAAGELLKQKPLAQPEYPEDYGSLEYEIAVDRLTCPPIWLSDLLGPRPLDDDFWRPPSRPIKEWCADVVDDEVRSAILAADRPGYVIVSQSSTTRSSKFRSHIHVTTGLVSPKTAHALCRAVQTARDPFDYHIPPEGHDHEIDKGEFKLKGWLKEDSGDSRFDRLDRFSNGVRRIEAAPGSKIVQDLGLLYRFSNGAKWFRAGIENPSMIYEVWGPPEVENERDEYLGEQVQSQGYRLLIAVDDLGEFLSLQDMHLIAEVGFRRDEKGKRNSSYDDEGSTEVELERVVVLEKAGAIRAAERDLGTWR